MQSRIERQPGPLASYSLAGRAEQAHAKAHQLAALVGRERSHPGKLLVALVAFAGYEHVLQGDPARALQLRRCSHRSRQAPTAPSPLWAASAVGMFQLLSEVFGVFFCVAIVVFDFV